MNQHSESRLHRKATVGALMAGAFGWITAAGLISRSKEAAVGTGIKTVIAT